MTTVRKIVTWQPVLTDHQAYTFQALGRAGGASVIAYVTTLEDSVRKAQGWTDTEVRSIERRLIPGPQALKYCYRQLREHRTDVHLFGSPFQQPALMICLLLAGLLGIEFYLVSEPYSPRAESYLTDNRPLFGKLKATLRPFLYRIYVLLLRRRVAGIFAISRLAVAQYQQAGIPLAKLFPFGYFVPCANAAPAVARPPLVGLRTIFVGSLIRRKGLDLLQVAARELRERGFVLTVDVYGPGSAHSFVPSCDGMRYCGTIPFGQAQTIISQYDLLVLPSRYDGWGVVVNEALCAGVPVVCSDQTGAGVVAEQLGAGLTFASGDARALANLLARLAGAPALLEAMHAAAPRAAASLQPEVAARYMLDVILAPVDGKASVMSPWYPSL